MLRAMDSAVAGLRAHQNKLDVIGHNLANVNTFGYKSQTYSFKETMYQTSSASTGGQAVDTGNTNLTPTAGSNAAQYGYGTLMGSIGMDMTASTPSYTGGFNACINGEGFFITSPQNKLATGSTGIAEADVKSSSFQYTRVGQFLIDNNGYMVDSNNNFIYGYQMTDNGTPDTTKGLVPLFIPTDVDTSKTPVVGDFSTIPNTSAEALSSTNAQINANGVVTATVEDSSKNKYTITIGQVALATFQNPNGLTKAGDSYYTTDTTDNAGRVAVGVPGGENASLMPGYIEASNVDMAREFSEMIMTHRGFQANSKMITVSDEILSELVNMKR